jgi:hypothetical protein
MAKNYTPDIMETIKAMAYGQTDAEIVANCGMDTAEVARIRTEYAADIAERKAVLKEAGYSG